MSKNISKQRCSADPTREKILKVAQKLFIKYGFAGTSISTIATLAKINQSLIYHHFVDKKTLWQQVKKNLLDHYAQCNEFNPLEIIADKDFKTFVQCIVKQRFYFFVKNPNVLRLLNWQRLEPNSNELYTNCHHTPEQWEQAIKKFHKRGEISPEFSPEFIQTLISTTVSGFLCDFQAIASINKKPKPEISNKHCQQLSDCLYRALSKVN